jgi:hypothetical protein
MWVIKFEWKIQNYSININIFMKNKEIEKM